MPSNATCVPQCRHRSTSHHRRHHRHIHPATTFPRSTPAEASTLKASSVAPSWPRSVDHPCMARRRPRWTHPSEIDFGPSPAINLQHQQARRLHHDPTSWAAPAPAISIPIIDLRPAPGFFNAATGRRQASSTGAGSASGLLNFSNNSGLYNFATAQHGKFGLQNYRSLQSGWANLDNSISVSTAPA